MVRVAVDDHLRAEEKTGQDLESAEDVADRPEEGMHFHQRSCPSANFSAFSFSNLLISNSCRA